MELAARAVFPAPERRDQSRSCSATYNSGGHRKMRSWRTETCQADPRRRKDSRSRAHLAARASEVRTGARLSMIVRVRSSSRSG